MIAGETEICWVDPNAGLMYRGYDIHEMAEKASFEEVAYLLLNGELPDVRAAEQVYVAKSPRPASLPKQVLDALRLMPKETHPMDMLRTGVSMLGPFDPDLNDHSHAANIRKAIRLIAKVSTLITDGYRIAHGEDPLPERAGPDHGGKSLLQTARRSAAGLADPNDGHDLHSCTPIMNSTLRPSRRG